MINSKSTETFLSDCNLTEMVGSLYIIFCLMCTIFLSFSIQQILMFSKKVGSLDDLNNYFVQPEEDLRFDEEKAT